MGIKLFTNVDIGDIPRTPAQPYFNSPLLDTARQTLLLHALDLGYPISFAQETIWIMSHGKSIHLTQK